VAEALAADEGDAAADDTGVADAVPAPHAAISAATITTTVNCRSRVHIGFTRW
jgi:hypothetical protein